MVFHVYGKKIDQYFSNISNQFDNCSETLEFILKKDYHGLDLSTLSPIFIFRFENGDCGYTRNVDSEDMGHEFKLSWRVIDEVTKRPGTLEFMIKLVDEDGSVKWISQVTLFNVKESLTWKNEGCPKGEPEQFYTATEINQIVWVNRSELEFQLNVLEDLIYDHKMDEKVHVTEAEKEFLKDLNLDGIMERIVSLESSVSTISDDLSIIMREITALKEL